MYKKVSCFILNSYAVVLSFTYKITCFCLLYIKSALFFHAALNSIYLSSIIPNTLLQSEKDDKKHFNMKKIVKSGKGGDFKVDLEDERFSAFKTSHHYAIDPSAPEYKDTSETQKLRVTQAASLAETEDRHSVADSGGKSGRGGIEKEGNGNIDIVSSDSVENKRMIEKIKNRTKQLQTKKDSSKIFKTKNKSIISSKQPEIGSTVTSETNQPLKPKEKKRKKENEETPGTSKKLKSSKKKKLKSQEL